MNMYVGGPDSGLYISGVPANRFEVVVGVVPVVVGCLVIVADGL